MKFKIVIVGLTWFVFAGAYGATMGLSLGWGPYSLIAVGIAGGYSLACYIHYLRWYDLTLLFTTLPYYTVLASVVAFAIMGIGFTTVSPMWCGFYSAIALVLLSLTYCESIEIEIAPSFMPTHSIGR